MIKLWVVEVHHFTRNGGSFWGSTSFEIEALTATEAEEIVLYKLVAGSGYFQIVNTHEKSI